MLVNKIFGIAIIVAMLIVTGIDYNERGLHPVQFSYLMIGVLFGQFAFRKFRTCDDFYSRYRG